MWVINRRLSGNRQLIFALPFDVDASVVLVGRDLDRGPQELRAPLEGPARDVDHAVHRLAHEQSASFVGVHAALAVAEDIAALDGERTSEAPAAVSEDAKEVELLLQLEVINLARATAARHSGDMDSFRLGLLPMAARYALAQWAHLRWTRMLLGRGRATHCSAEVAVFGRSAAAGTT